MLLACLAFGGTFLYGVHNSVKHVTSCCQ